MSNDRGPQQDPAGQPPKASLLDAEARGGPTAVRGFDFQRAYALILLIESVTDPDWSAVLVEGAEDVEARFDRLGKVERRAIQLKNYRVTTAKAKEIVGRFEKLDKDSPGTWTAFVIACTELDDTLKAIHNGLERYRPLHPGSFYAADDPILANTRAEVECQIGEATLPVEFVLERVTFEPGLQAYKGEEWVRARALDLLHKAYPGINRAAAEGIYLRLYQLVSESTGRPIERQQAMAVIDAARAEPAEVPTHPTSLQFTPEIVEWLHAAGYEYHCFISWPHISNRELAECASQVRNGLEDELSLLFPNPRVYFAQADIEEEDQWRRVVGQALCRSVVMVAICAPVYYYPDYHRCGLEWAAMELLSAKRLPGLGLKAIIPAFVRRPEHLPGTVQSISDQHIDLSGVATSGRRYYKTRDFKRNMIKIREHFERLALALAFSGAQVDCKHFEPPAESAFANYIPSRQGFPFRS